MRSPNLLKSLSFRALLLFFSWSVLHAPMTYGADSGLTSEESENAILRKEAAEALFDSISRSKAVPIPLEELFEELGLTPPWPRMYRMIARMDPDKDGEITRPEMVTGMHAIVGVQVDRNMDLDGNLDELLSMYEYSLGYVDLDSPKNDEGFTENQIESFKRYDTNQDDGLSRQELDADVTRYYLRLFRAWRVTGELAARRFATDGTITLVSFAWLHGVEIGDEIPHGVVEQFETWAGGETTPPLRYLGGYLARKPLEEFSAIEDRVMKTTREQDTEL